MCYELIKYKLNRICAYVKTILVWKRIFGCVGKHTFIYSPRLIFGCKRIKIGSRTTIEKDSTLYSVSEFAGVVLDGEIIIGNNCYINHSFNVTCANSVIIENNVTIAFNVAVFDNNHGINNININYNKQPLQVNSSIKIAEGAWIGANCFILASIGKGCVIGANSVITKPIPDYCIAVGNPARVIKKYDFEKKEWIKV